MHKLGRLKKLTLSVESIRVLSPVALTRAAGGRINDSTDTACDTSPSKFNSCTLSVEKCTPTTGDCTNDHTWCSCSGGDC